MAKAKRNLAPLRRDNRTSNLPLVCTTKDCDEDFYVSYPRNNSPVIKRKCAHHFANPPQDRRKNATILQFKQAGLL